MFYHLPQTHYIHTKNKELFEQLLDEPWLRSFPITHTDMHRWFSYPKESDIVVGLHPNCQRIPLLIDRVGAFWFVDLNTRDFFTLHALWGTQSHTFSDYALTFLDGFFVPCKDDDKKMKYIIVDVWYIRGQKVTHVMNGKRYEMVLDMEDQLQGWCIMENVDDIYFEGITLYRLEIIQHPMFSGKQLVHLLDEFESVPYKGILLYKWKGNHPISGILKKHIPPTGQFSLQDHWISRELNYE